MNFYCSVTEGVKTVKIRKVHTKDLYSSINPQGWEWWQLFGFEWKEPIVFNSLEEAQEFCKKEFPEYKIDYFDMTQVDIKEFQKYIIKGGKRYE